MIQKEITYLVLLLQLLKKWRNLYLRFLLRALLWFLNYSKEIYSLQ
jgi:hypothetical protein